MSRGHQSHIDKIYSTTPVIQETPPIEEITNEESDPNLGG